MPSEKKQWGRLSTTAAETKVTYDREIMMMEDDIFDVEFGVDSKGYGRQQRSRDVKDRKSSNKIVTTKTLQHTTTMSLSNQYFSRITYL